MGFIVLEVRGNDSKSGEKIRGNDRKSGDKFRGHCFILEVAIIGHVTGRIKLGLPSEGMVINNQSIINRLSLHNRITYISV